MADYTVVDVDAHYIDHLEDIYRYLDDDDPWKEQFKRGYEKDQNDYPSTFWPKMTQVQHETGTRRPEFRSKDDILDAMDEIGIDKVLLIGQQMIQLGAIRADDLRPVKYTEAYVDYLLDEIVDPKEGIYMTVPVAHSDPEAAVDIIERVASEEAVVGTCVVAKGGQPPFGNRRYDPIYAACEKHGLPVIFHSGASSLDDYYLRGFETTLETHTLGFLITIMSQITSIVVQGVPEKFPDLELVFEEAGLFYIPSLMYRLDQEYLRQPEEAPLLEKLPSEYMKEFYYGTQPLEIVPNDAYFEYLFEMIGGVERLMYASDWPHQDYDETNVITDLSFLSSDEKAKILGGNAERVFGI